MTYPQKDNRMGINKKMGIIAGLICFGGFVIIIWGFPIILSLMVAPETLDNLDLKWFFLRAGSTVPTSAFFGFSMATKSRLLKFISLALVAITLYIVVFI